MPLVTPQYKLFQHQREIEVHSTKACCTATDVDIHRESIYRSENRVLNRVPCLLAHFIQLIRLLLRLYQRILCNGCIAFPTDSFYVILSDVLAQSHSVKLDWAICLFAFFDIFIFHKFNVW